MEIDDLLSDKEKLDTLYEQYKIDCKNRFKYKGGFCKPEPEIKLAQINFDFASLYPNIHNIDTSIVDRFMRLKKREDIINKIKENN